MKVFVRNILNRFVDYGLPKGAIMNVLSDGWIQGYLNIQELDELCQEFSIKTSECLPANDRDSFVGEYTN